MAWTIGAVHNLSGSGTTAISAPDALAIVTTSVSPRSGVKVGQPPSYFGLGHLSPGGTSGYLRDIPIQHISQLEILPTNELTILGYTLQPGTAITVTELRAAAAVSGNVVDRNPLAIVRGVSFDVTAHPSNQRWTYEVPANRLALLEHAALGASPSTSGAAAGWLQLWLWWHRDSGEQTYLLQLNTYDEAPRQPVVSNIAGGLLLKAGDGISCYSQYSGYNWWRGSTSVALTEFDA